MIDLSTTSVSRPVIALVGPTAIGKTALSLELASRFGCEIVSVDSMQVYRYMDIGTAKILPEEMCDIPHHLIDIVTPDIDYDAARFCRDAHNAMGGIWDRGKIPLLTGGTGLYLKALVNGLFNIDLPTDNDVRIALQKRVEMVGIEKLHEELCTFDPLSASRIHPHDTSRILRGLEIFLLTGKPWSDHLREHRQAQSHNHFSLIQIALTCDRELLYSRINKRTIAMIENGFEQEVAGLLDMGYGRELRSMNAIGYRHMVNYIKADWKYAEMVELLQRDTRRYAKRQYTWFRGIEGIEWFPVDEASSVIDRISRWLDDR